MTAAPVTSLRIRTGRRQRSSPGLTIAPVPARFAEHSGLRFGGPGAAPDHYDNC